MWRSIEFAEKDGRQYLLRDSVGGSVYLGYWTDDVYEVQCGSGGPSGWFSGTYYDHWGDRPKMESPIEFHDTPE